MWMSYGRTRNVRTNTKFYVSFLQVTLTFLTVSIDLQCCDTVISWASGRASGLYKSSDEMSVWLSVCSEVQIVCIWSS